MNRTDKVDVFLGGEGRNDLGSRAGHPSYQSDDHPGVLQTLLCRVQPTGWKVVRAKQWKDIHKYRAHPTRHGDFHNIVGLILDAKDLDCDIVAFVRDRDTDVDRPQAIDEGIAFARIEFADVPEIVGTVAVPKLEGWILALQGTMRTEEMSPSKAEDLLALKGIQKKDTSGMVAVVEEADFERIPEDAAGLRKWLELASDILPRKVRQAYSR